MRFPEQYSSYLREPLQTHDGGLELELVSRDGKTYTDRRLAKGQLSVSRPLGVRPGTDSFYLINTAGGIVQGDRLDTRITLGKGSKSSHHDTVGE